MGQWSGPWSRSASESPGEQIPASLGNFDSEFVEVEPDMCNLKQLPDTSSTAAVGASQDKHGFQSSCLTFGQVNELREPGFLQQ